MITIKLPYSVDNTEDIKYINQLRRQQSSVIRYSYCRFEEDYKEKEIRRLIKDNLNNINDLDSWFIQSGIKEGTQIYETNKKKSSNRKVVFGGRYNIKMWNRTKNLIHLERYKQRRLLPLTIQGEALRKGNRKFDFNIIDDNEIIFKPKKGIKIHLKLPKMRKNLKNKLYDLQLSSEEKKLPCSIKLDDKFIYIIYDENKLYNLKNSYEFKKDRILSLDLNPNYIGLVVKDYNKDEILFKEVISIKKLNDIEKKFKGLSSSDKKVKKLKNKRKFETLEISKYVSKLAKHYHCEAIGVEKLKMNSKDHKWGKNYNRLVNNNWLRVILYQNLKKRCEYLGIKFIEVYPQYSSFIGCIEHPNEVDSIAAAFEIGRRTHKLLNYDRNKHENIIFPNINVDRLLHHWKDVLSTVDIRVVCKDWKSLYKHFKGSEIKYRLIFDDIDPSFIKCHRHKTMKSFVLKYQLI